MSNFRAVKQPESMARIADNVLGRVERRAVARRRRRGHARCRDAILKSRAARREVRLLGLRGDVENILPDTDLLLVTSQTESFCLVALEALACGVPVLAPRVGGLPEVVEHGHNGFLYDPGDEEQATRLAVRFLTDVPLQARMRTAALARAAELAAAKVIPRYEALYREVVRAHREVVRARRAATLTPAAAEG